jgi:ATP-dependent RNA/DNA helicase IGHMBP2
MPLLHLEPLPPRTTKGDLLDLLAGAGLDRRRVGRIDLRGRLAVIEVPDGWPPRLVKALDGAAFKDGRLRAWSAAPAGGGDDHFHRLARLLELEGEAEARQALERVKRLPPAEAERTGECLTDLVITDEYSGLGGRCILTLAKRNRTLPLPWNRLGAGTPVLLSAAGSDPDGGLRGVVCERGDHFLRVAVNDPPEGEDGVTWRVDVSSDETARQRQRQALDRARGAERDRLAELRQVLLGEQAPQFDPPADCTPLDPALNPSQLEAVRFALAARDLAVLHGPPGTGKTTTVVELIRQAVRRGAKVLACAPSNLAVDNLLERLLACGEQAVRLGHPARVLPELRAHTLDLLVDEHDDARLARKLAKEAFALFRKAARFTRARPEPGARRDMRQEAREMLADARRLESQAVEQVLNRATVLCATLTGLDSEVLGRRHFDLAVVDEACQCTEPACWLPLLRSERVVLAGDHCQLPPTVLSREAAEQGFHVSLMERLVELYGPDVTRRLEVQYRMHEAIMAFSSAEFYDGALQADDAVRGHLLSDLPGVEANPLTATPVQFIDTAGAGFDEEVEPDGESRLNPSEARLVARKVRALLEAGVPATDVAVIAPYAAQVRRLREYLAVPGLEIDSVDGFQGREKEAVVLSLVRSNPEGEIGFLADVRRMNVAMTRARRKLLVAGDSATLAGHPFYRRFLEHVEALGAYQTVWDEPVDAADAVS